ncbi:hypothetical protein SLA2020_146750 [Shorea laevis]
MEALSMVAQPLLSTTFDWMPQKLDGFLSSISHGLQKRSMPIWKNGGPWYHKFVACSKMQKRSNSMKIL